MTNQHIPPEGVAVIPETTGEKYENKVKSE
jgi:hypothetical protein